MLDDVWNYNSPCFCWMMSETITTVHVFATWVSMLDGVWNYNSPCFCWMMSETITTVHVFATWVSMLDDVWNNNSPCFYKVSQHVGWCLKLQQSMFLCFCMVSHHFGWHGWKWAQVAGWQLEQQHSNNPCQVSQHVMWNFHLKLEHQHTQVTIHQNINNDGLWQ